MRGDTNMKRNEFEKYRYITYLDEVTNYEFSDRSFKSIVSISMPKNKYIDELEKKWSDMRKRFNIPDGVCLHFTDIKALLNPRYFDREEYERNEDIENIFCNNNTVDQEKLINFYKEVIQIIEKTEIDIVVTGKRFEKNSMTKNKLVRQYINSEWYILFKDHLDKLAEYMLTKSFNKFSANKKKDRKFKILKTKLRYDGDYGLMSRDDFRDAYAHIISNGTSNYNRELAKECFDNLKFVDKQEVGLCNTCESNCDIKRISHAGNEILDFIALYASNLIFKEYMIKDYMNAFNKDESDAKNYYYRNSRIYIGDHSIYPHEVLKNKIL